MTKSWDQHTFLKKNITTSFPFKKHKSLLQVHIDNGVMIELP